MVKEFITKFKKAISLLLLLTLIFAQVPILINTYMYEFSSRYFLTVEEASKENFDCVLVLGAGVWGDGPSHLLEERLNKGVEVYNTGCTNRILMTGDHGREEYDEVNVMKQYALDAGISETDIFMDHAGFSTYESMYRAKEIFGINKMIIVTQKYHLSRAVYIANKLGIEAYGVASDYQSFSGQLGRDSREVLARVKDIFTVVLKPKPTYLGKSIPISGDGTVTNG